MIKMLLYEENIALKEVLTMSFNGMPSLKILENFVETKAMASKIEYHAPDIILLDSNLLSKEVEILIRSLPKKANAPQCIIMHTFADDRRLLSAFSNGAKGSILKSSPIHRMFEQINYINHGAVIIPSFLAGEMLKSPTFDLITKFDPNISAKAIQFLTLLANGYSYPMIVSETDWSLPEIEVTARTIWRAVQNQSSPAAHKVS